MNYKQAFEQTSFGAESPTVAGAPWPLRLAGLLWPAWLAIVVLVALNLAVVKLDDVMQNAIATGNRWVVAEKSAMVHLLRHVESGEASELAGFQRRMALPMALRSARIELGREPVDVDAAAAALVAAGVDPGDARARVRFVQATSRIFELVQTRQHWKHADEGLDRLAALARESQRLHQAAPPLAEEKAKLAREILAIDEAIDASARDAAQSILSGSRTIRAIATFVNVGVSVLLLVLITSIAARALLNILHTKDQLRQAHARYEMAVQAANEGLWDWDLAGRRGTWTPRMRELLAYPSDASMAALGLGGMLHPADRVPTMRSLVAHLRGDTERLDATLRLQRADGNHRWFRVRGRALRDAAGRTVRLSGTLTDVHDQVVAAEERERADQARMQASAELELALDAAHVALWGYEPPTGRLLHARRWDVLVGYDDMPRTFEGWQALIHPEDRERRLAALQRHLANETPYYESEFRMQHANGQWVWLRSRGRVTRRAPDGTALEYAGAVMNVSTEMAARELQRRQYEFLQAMIEGIDTGIMLSSLERVRYVNASFCRILGYSDKHDLIGRPVAAFARSREVAERIMERRRSAMAGGEQPLSIVELFNAHGNPVRVVMLVSHVKWNGDSHFISTVTPLTEFERAEELLKSAQYRFERTLVSQLEAQQAHIARELHDSLGSVLAGLSLLIGMAKNPGPVSLDELLDRCQDQVREAAECTRSLARGIMPVSGGGQALGQALEQFVHDLGDMKSVHAAFELGANIDDLSEADANHLYRIVQEATSNAIRHGSASVIRIALRQSGALRRLDVDDDGRGWGSRGEGRQNGSGLRSIQARAEMLGARTAFGASDMGGARVSIVLPPQVASFENSRGRPAPFANSRGRTTSP